MSWISLSVTLFKISLTVSTNSILKQIKVANLLIVRRLILHLSFDIAKELLNRVKPRTVLCTEEDHSFQFKACFQNSGVVVDHCIVHHYNYSLETSLWITAKMPQDFKHEAFKEGSIKSPFNYLGTNYLVLSYRCDIRH